MPVELFDLISDIALHVTALIDVVPGGVHHLYAGGMPDGLDLGALGAGAVAGAGAGAAAVAGVGGGGGLNVGRDDFTSFPTTRGHGTDQRLHDRGVAHEHFGEGGTVSREDWRGSPATRVLRTSRAIERWVQSYTGVDIIGTVPGGSRD